ncbi:MAG: tyrosine-type recombinase/integrase [Gemmatimonadota bacterium]
MAKTNRHPGNIEERGDGYRVSLRVAGERHRFTLPNVTRREAEAFAKRKAAELEEISSRRALGLPDLLPFAGIGAAACRERAGEGEEPVPAGFLDKWELERVPELAPRSQVSYGQVLARARLFFDRHHPGLRVDEVRPGHIREYLTWRQGRVWRRLPGRGRGMVQTAGRASGSTMQRERATLRVAFEYAVELELRESNPVAAVKAPKVVKRTPVILTDAQFEALLHECEHDPMLWLYVLTLGETGQRCDSEALRAEWEDVQLETGFIWLESGRRGRQTKGKKGRWIPMTPRLLAAMREHFARYRLATYGGQRTRYVFHHTRNHRTAVAGARIASLRRAFKTAAARAGLPDDLHQHDLRHRSVTNMLARGKSAVLVKEMHGHADLRTTMDYTHLAREHLRELVAVDEPPPPAVRSAGL